MPDLITDNRLARPAGRPRITYSMSLHHQIPGEDAKTIKLNGDKPLDVEENPYERALTIKDEFVPLDFGWLSPDMVGSIVLYNITGRGRPTQPTPEEREQDASAVLVLDRFPGIVIPPAGVPTVIHLDKDFSGVKIKSLGTPARLICIGIPR